MTRDLLDMEQLTSEFPLRNESCQVSVLRLGFRVSEDTTLGHYLSLPIVPTFAGYDPRLQLLHEDDAVEAIVRAVLGEHPGVFNVAADGVVLLSQAIAIMGGAPAPILPPYGHWLSRLAPRTGARACMAGSAGGKSLGVMETPPPPREYELQVSLQRRRREGRNGYRD